MKNIIVIGIILIIFGSAVIIAVNRQKDEEPDDDEGKIFPINGEIITSEYNFSYPTFGNYGDYVTVYIEEADFYDIHDGWPVLPVKSETYEFPFGTKILDVIYEFSEPEAIPIEGKISYGSCSTKTGENGNIYNASDRFPSSFVSFKKGGGLSNNEHKTFLTIRLNPLAYRPMDYEIDFIKNMKVTVVYEPPEEPLFEEKDDFDLLIVTISDFKKPLQKLVTHKQNKGVKTKLVTLNEITNTEGRDTAEKIKYYIKESIENLGIKYVLLIGGIKGQSLTWNIPPRYSHVIISDGKQEGIEPEFLADLYFADIYDSEGNFSSWDSNENDIFAERDGGTIIDEMDLYPDVYFGRLPCRSKIEVRVMVNKIINYEKTKAQDKWFKNLILVSGDHWDDPEHISEGVLIMDKTAEIMDGFNPKKLYATESNILLVRHINSAFNKGAGFAYFCGHGSATMWGIHYPPDAKGWAPSLTKLRIQDSLYKVKHMNLLRNRYKLPITIVGGCLNGKYDISIQWGLENRGKLLLSVINCWAWKLTSKWGGGSIATIANTGLGTHAMSDSDQNGVNDYLEVLDGWMELRFFELYSKENVDILGNLHCGAMKDYLHTFLNSNDEMDVKMVHQWQLFGDPSLKVGGY